MLVLTFLGFCKLLISYEDAMIFFPKILYSGTYSFAVTFLSSIFNIRHAVACVHVSEN